MTVAIRFKKAISLISEDFHKARTFISDKRLTQTEKKIIQGYGELRVSNFDWILKEIPELLSVDDFVRAQKHLLIGIALNNSGRCGDAEKELELARKLLDSEKYPESYFLAEYNLFVAQQNLQDITKIKKTFTDLKVPSFPEGSLLWLRHQRMCFNYYSMISSFDQSVKVLKKIKLWQTKMDDNQKISWIIDQLKFYIKIPDYQNCYGLLEELKKNRVFYLSADYNFIKATLDFLTKSSTLYLYDRDIRPYPLLYHQSRVLTSLEEINIQVALKHWSALSEMSPNIYLEEFNYNGDICLFSRCLERLVAKIKRPTVMTNISALTKEEKLFQLLQENPLGLSKEVIYLEIWSLPLKDKDNLVKLSKLVQRVKLKYNIEILSRKGTYQMAPSPKKKQA